MRNETKEWLVSIAEVVAFFVLCGIIGGMELEWETEKETRIATMHGNHAWEVGR